MSKPRRFQTKRRGINDEESCQKRTVGENNEQQSYYAVSYKYILSES